MTFKTIFNKFRNPAGVMTRRYFSKIKDPIVLHHRNAFLFVPKGKSKFIYWCFAIIQQLAWWGYFGWKALFKTWKEKEKWKTNIIFQQPLSVLLELCYLTFVYTIPPVNYYLFQLYQYPKTKWLQFIFDHEASKWQQSLNKDISRESKQYVNSKFYFTKKSIKNNIPVVPTIKYIKQGAKLKKINIFQRKSFFFKPDNANRSKGCFSLIYEVDEDKYMLSLEMSDINYSNQEKILAVLNQAILKYNYLQQTYVENHPFMAKICGTKRLTTIRIVTFYNKGDVLPISAVLESPNLKDRKKYRLVRIDVQSGILSKRGIFQDILEINDSDKRWFESISYTPLPNWTYILSVLKKSHRLCPDYSTIGWDVAISNLIEPVVIIEGNAGWGTKVHQVDSYYLSKKNPLVDIVVSNCENGK